MYACMLSHCETLWTAAHQASWSTEFSRQEHWSGLPFPSPILHYRQILYHWATREAWNLPIFNCWQIFRLKKNTMQVRQNVLWVEFGLLAIFFNLWLSIWESDTTERLHFQFSLSAFMHWRRKWQPTPGFLLGESQGQWSLVGCCLWGHTELGRTDAT